MADTNSIKVSFGGDVAGLSAAKAVAQSELRDFNAEVRRLADSVRASSGQFNAHLTDALKNAAQQALSSKAEIASLSRAMSDAGRAARESGDGAQRGGAGIGFYAREVHALIDEFVSGRTGQLQGTIANITGTFLSSRTALIPYVAGVATLGIAIASMAARAREAREATASFIDGLSAKGNLSAFRGDLISVGGAFEKLRGSAFSEFRDSIKDIARDLIPVNSAMTLSKDEANELLGALSKFPGVNSQVLDSVSSLATEIRGAFGSDVFDRFSKSFGAAGSDPKKFLEEAAAGWADLSEADRQGARDAAASADAITQQQAAIRLLLNEFARARGEEALSTAAAKASSAEERQRILALRESALATGNWSHALREASHISDDAKNQFSRIVGVIHDVDAAMGKTTLSSGQLATNLRAAFEAVGPSVGNIQRMTQELERLKGAMAAFGSTQESGKNGLGSWWNAERLAHARQRLQDEAGLSDFGASGLVARWAGVEAPGGPSSVNPSSGAFGIGQWLGSRQHDILGNEDFDAQLSHAIKDLSHPDQSEALATLRGAQTPAEGARGASQYERAEGYNRATGLDNYTDKTPVAQVKSITDAAQAANELAANIQKAKDAQAGGNAIQKQELESAQNVLRLGEDQVRTQQEKLAAIEKQLAVPLAPSERTQLETEKAQTEQVLKKAQAERESAQWSLKAAEAKDKSPESYDYQRRAVEAKIPTADATERIGLEKQLTDITAREAAQRAEFTAKGLDEEVEKTKTSFALRAEEIKKLADMGGLSAQNESKTAIAALKEEDAALAAIYARKKALYDQDEIKFAEVEKQKQAAHDAILKQIAQKEEEAAKKSAEAWKSLSQTLSSDMTSTITGLIEHSKKFSDSMRDMARQVLSYFVKMGTDWVASFATSVLRNVATQVVGEQTMTAATEAGTAARLGAQAAGSTAGIAAQAAAVIKALSQDAAQTFGGVFAFLSPFLGPAAAGPAAGAAATVAGAAASFDIGAYQVPHDLLSIVHRDELVMPAAQASAFRSLLEGGGAAGGSGHTINVAPNVHFNISALDGASVESVLNANGRALARAVGKHVADGAHYGIRGLTR